MEGTVEGDPVCEIEVGVRTAGAGVTSPLHHLRRSPSSPAMLAGRQS
jgi:hypothetical protein